MNGDTRKEAKIRRVVVVVVVVVVVTGGGRLLFVVVAITAFNALSLSANSRLPEHRYRPYVQGYGH